MSGILAALVGAAGGRILTIAVIPDGDDTSYGFQGVLGSLTPTEFLGANINNLSWSTTNQLTLSTDNGSLTNAGWDSININGTIFLRTSASFTAGSWRWSSVTTNPIGTTAGAGVIVNIA